MEKLIPFIAENGILVGAFALVLISFLIYEFKNNTFAGSGISTQEATQILNQNQSMLIDVRSPEKFKTGHIANAKNHTLETLTKNLNPLKKYKSKPIVIACDNGSESNKAAAHLRQNQFEKVFVLQGGLNKWSQDQLPLVKPTTK